jgi:polysaccharide export outer membrane protein
MIGRLQRAFLSGGTMKRLSLLWVLAATLLAACAGPNLPSAPAKASQAQYAYTIGAGDLLRVTVWRHPEVSGDVQVRGDGKVTMPLIEDTVAVGKTPGDLGRELEARLRRYLQDPVVTVQVQQSGGTGTEQVRVVGQAQRPAALPYRQNMTLLDAMLAVGGLTPFAAGNRAVLVRGVEGNKQYGVRLQDLMRSGDISANVEVLPGDVIVIPESRF